MKNSLGVLTLALFLPLSTFASPPEQFSVRIQLAQVDYAVIHDQLIEKCKISSPESVQELSNAIALWDSNNSLALRKLKVISGELLAKIFKIPQAEAVARSRRISEMMTNGLKEKFDNISSDELKTACSGGYATSSLQSPMLNFSELLNEIVLVKKSD